LFSRPCRLSIVSADEFIAPKAIAKRASKTTVTVKNERLIFLRVLMLDTILDIIKNPQFY
jgi:hypothetical protein